MLTVFHRRTLFASCLVLAVIGVNCKGNRSVVFDTTPQSVQTEEVTCNSISAEALMGDHVPLMSRASEVAGGFGSAAQAFVPKSNDMILQKVEVPLVYFRETANDPEQIQVQLTLSISEDDNGAPKADPILKSSKMVTLKAETMPALAHEIKTPRTVFDLREAQSPKPKGMVPLSKNTDKGEPKRYWLVIDLNRSDDPTVGRQIAWLGRGDNPEMDGLSYPLLQDSSGEWIKEPNPLKQRDLLFIFHCGAF